MQSSRSVEGDVPPCANAMPEPMLAGCSVDHIAPIGEALPERVTVLLGVEYPSVGGLTQLGSAANLSSPVSKIDTGAGAVSAGGGPAPDASREHEPILTVIGRALLQLVPSRVRRFFRDRFADATPSERTGYLVWSAMGIVIGVPEIWAAVSGDDFYWPTISTTVGHLQARWPVLTLVPVALIVGYGYSALRIKPATTALQADLTAITRTPQGRLTRHDVTLQQLAEGTPPPADRPQFSSTPYFAIATVIVIVAGLLASRSDNRFLVGYILYSLIAVFWVIIPNVVAYRFERDIPFTTLVATINCLARRLALVAAVVAALLVILLIHLAFYPWPSRS